MEGLSGSGSGFLISAASWRCRCRSVRRSHCIEPYRPVDILEGFLAKIVEGEIGLASDLLECTPGQADAARLAFVLDPRGDIDAVAKNIVTLDDDVADVDADPKRNLLRRAIGLLCHLALHFDGAGNRIDGASELDQHSVASGLNDAAFVRCNGGIDDLAAYRLEGRQRSDLVGPHKPRIASDISRQHRRQSPLDAPARHEAPA